MQEKLHILKIALYKNCTKILMIITDIINLTAFKLSVDKFMLNHLFTVSVSTEFKITLDLSLIDWDLSLIESVKDSISFIWLLTEALLTEVSFLTAVQN